MTNGKAQGQTQGQGQARRQTQELWDKKNRQVRCGSELFDRGGALFCCGRKLLYMAAALLIIVCIGGVMAPKAFAASPATSITGVTELRDWNEKRGAASAVLKDNLFIRNSVTLDAKATSWKKELDMDDYYIHILSGGTLTINNKDFLLSGSEKMITVDAGGTLILREGTINGTDDETVISLKTGSTYKKSTNFNLTGNVVRIGSDETQESEGPAQPQLLSVAEDSLSLACMEGASLSFLALPASVKVSYLTAEGKTEELSLPITWDTSGMNLNAAGVYKLKGTFSEETLKKHALTNPGQVTATLLLAVMKPEDAGTLSVRMISEDSAGNTVIRLEFPMLTSDVTALYLYSSTDGEHFKRESWSQPEAGGGFSQTENFLAKCTGKVNPPWQYLEYSCRPGGPFWLQLEIVGSALAGKTNVVECDSLEEREPGKMKGSGNGGGTVGTGGAAGAGAGNGTGGAAGNGSGGYFAGGVGVWGAGISGGRTGAAVGNGAGGGAIGGSGELAGAGGGVSSGNGTDAGTLPGGGTPAADATQDNGQGEAESSDSLSGTGFAREHNGESMMDGAEGDEFGEGGFLEGPDVDHPRGAGESDHKTAGWKNAAAVAVALVLILASAGGIWWFRKYKKHG